MFDLTRQYLQTIGFPGEDLQHLPTSSSTFADRAHFRLEVPTVNSFAAAKSLLQEAKHLGITINRNYGNFWYLSSYSY
ncbi:MAG: hypothetical protein AAFV28_15190 [Cyanobacteria bacterium J06635_13]